jgi:hypothetical protein
LNRITFAFRSFFALLFQGRLPEDIARAFGYSKATIAAPTAPGAAPKASAGPADGAVQMLSILQRDSRLVDFLMEDISGYSDDQVGAAVRDLHVQARQSLERYLSLQPVIDGVEGTFTKVEGLESTAYRLIGNVPADGRAPGGLLRHKGWRATNVDLPKTPLTNIVAQAELEIE